MQAINILPKAYSTDITKRPIKCIKSIKKWRITSHVNHQYINITETRFFYLFRQAKIFFFLPLNTLYLSLDEHLFLLFLEHGILFFIFCVCSWNSFFVADTGSNIVNIKFFKSKILHLSKWKKRKYFIFD